MEGGLLRAPEEVILLLSSDMDHIFLRIQISKYTSSLDSSFKSFESFFHQMVIKV